MIYYQHLAISNGVVFVALEDETGMTNRVVWNALAQRQRRELLRSAVGAHAWKIGATPITPHKEGSNFELQWEIGTFGQDRVDLFMSNDPWLGPPDPWGRENLLFKQLSGIGSSYADAFHVDTVFMNCRFTTDNVLSCGALSYENPGRDITPFLPQFPKTGYVILRACDAFMEYCATSSLFVEFQ